MHKGVTSVGVVVNKEIYTQRARSQSDKPTGDSPNENGKVGSANGSLFQTLGKNLGFFQPVSEPTKSKVSPSTQRYLETLELAPGLKKLLGDGKLTDHPASDAKNPSLVHTASDYSYSSDRYAGNGWRVIGDAGGG